MADNYLEKKMEEFRSGKKVVRRPSASLEVLLSTLALADTEDASSYKLFTRLISILSLRYSYSLCITTEQPYFHTRVDNTLAFYFKHFSGNELSSLLLNT